MTIDASTVNETQTHRVSAILDAIALALSLAPGLWAIFGTGFRHLPVTWALALALGFALRNLGLAWRVLAGTALRPATVWAMLAVLIALFAVVFVDTTAPGRPRQGLFAHLAFLAALASLVSVLGARKPGESAWAILCGLFLAIGLLPMLEGIGLAKRFDVLDQLRSESPWTYFFVLVIIAGAGNYLPTRFSLPALILGTGLLHHLRLLWTPEGRAEWRGEYWYILPWALAVSISLGAILARRPRKFETPAPFHQFWIPFRDAWGAAWALRVLERVNQSAARNGWPERLTWFGLVGSADSNSTTGESIESQDSKSAGELANSVQANVPVAFPNAIALTATLTVFLRRFGDTDVIRKF